MSEIRPYREGPEPTPREVLVFYPGIPLSEGLLRLTATAFGLLALLVALATFRLALAWLMVPLLFLVIYATRGERHEVEISEYEVVLRRELWPLKAREWHIPRDEMLRVFVEEYDGEGRLIFETRRGEKLPLTEAYYTNKEHMHELCGRLDSMLFQHPELPG